MVAALGGALDSTFDLRHSSSEPGDIERIFGEARDAAAPVLLAGGGATAPATVATTVTARATVITPIQPFRRGSVRRYAQGRRLRWRLSTASIAVAATARTIRTKIQIATGI